MRSYWPLILLLAAMWGASYLFIKVAVEDIPPAAMTDLRLSIAAVLLTGYLVQRTGAASAAIESRRSVIAAGGMSSTATLMKRYEAPHIAARSRISGQ